ncbi:MAG: stage II sporulation protein R [Eubacteriales bacterium]
MKNHPTSLHTNKMVRFALGLLLSALLVGVLPVSGEEDIYDSVVRLHVLANSDTEQDQELKLRVRDELLQRFGTQLAGCADMTEASEMLTLLREDLQACAVGVVASADYDYPVAVTFTRERYPACAYGEVTLPAGEYLSLRVLIGEGAGQNWWCVLFPPLCLSLATDSPPEGGGIPVGLTPNEYRLISDSDKAGPYAVKFKVLELLERAESRRPRR